MRNLICLMLSFIMLAFVSCTKSDLSLMESTKIDSDIEAKATLPPIQVFPCDRTFEIKVNCLVIETPLKYFVTDLAGNFIDNGVISVASGPFTVYTNPVLDHCSQYRVEVDINCGEFDGIRTSDGCKGKFRC